MPWLYWISYQDISSYSTNYCQTSNISRTLVGKKIVDHSDVVGAASALLIYIILDLTPGINE